MKKSNIVLIGMPGVGKSTVGVILAKLAGKAFCDTDLVIQERQGRLLSQIIAERGAAGFVELENSCIAALEAKNSVIATGGSAVYGRQAMANLSAQGVVVYLRAGFELLEARLHDIKGRGVVALKGQSLRELYDERCPLYEKYADITVDCDKKSIEQTVNAILDQI